MERRLGNRLPDGISLAFTSKDGDEIYGVAYYYNFAGSGLEVAIAADSPKWATRKNLDMGFSYPFKQLGCRRISGRISVNNPKALSLAERLGFTREGTLRQAGDDGEDIAVFGMLKDECQWVRK